MPVGALSAALSGIQRAAAELEASSHNVARMLPQALSEAEAADPETAEGAQAEPESSQPVSIEREMVRQSLAAVQAKASMRVISVELDLIGSLVDIMA
jgi:hypothetical protein